MLVGFIRSVLGVMVLSSRWIVRQPGWLVQSIINVTGFAIILWAWGGMRGLENLLIAWLVSMGWGLGVNIIGQHVGYERLFGILDIYIASPVTPARYVAGVTLAGLPYAAVPYMLVFLISLAIGKPELALAGTLASLALLPVSASLGLAVAMRIKKPTNISAITNPIANLLTILPPVFYPLYMVPEPLRPLALSAPTAAAAELARAVAGTGSVAPAWQPALSLLLWLAASTAVAAKVVKWGQE